MSGVRIYTYPSKKSLLSVMNRVRTLTRRKLRRKLADLLRRLNPVLQGWCNYFRHGVCKQTFGYVDHYTWWKIVAWIRKRHLGLNWGQSIGTFSLVGRFSAHGVDMFRPQSVAIERYRYGATESPRHGRARQKDHPSQWHDPVESRMPWNLHARLYVQRVVMLKADLMRSICPAQPHLWQWHVQHNQRPSRKARSVSEGR